MFFRDRAGAEASIPGAYTDVQGVDPFVAFGAGRSVFRVVDLLELAELLQRLRS